MTNYVVYADVLWALNFFLDFFLLWATGRFLRLHYKMWRLLLSAVVGAVYGTLLLVPALSWCYTLPGAIISSLLLLIIAFSFGGWISLLKKAASFYLIAFAMAGAVLGGSQLLSQQGIVLGATGSIRAGTLLFGVFMALILARRGVVYLKQLGHKESFIVELKISILGRSCLIKGLIDTGNNLNEPVSGLPVIVCEYRSLMGLLPQGLRNAYQQYADPALVLQQPLPDGWGRRLRLVPFDSIGYRHGLLLGFRPDKVVLNGEKTLATDAVIIGLAQQSFAGGEYQAIVNPEILLAAEIIKEVSA